MALSDYLKSMEEACIDRAREHGVKVAHVRTQFCVGPMARKRGERGTGEVKTIGLCEYNALSLKTGRQVTISDTIGDPVEVMAVMMHELIHAWMPVDEGHGANFAKACYAVGLEGKPTSTRPGKAFKEWAKGVIAELGEYPHRAVNVRRPGQGTYMHKVVCRDGLNCGCIIRASSKWVGTEEEPREIFCVACGGPAQVADWGMSNSERRLVNAALNAQARK